MSYLYMYKICLCFIVLMFVIEGPVINKIYLYMCTCKALELPSENKVITIIIVIMFDIFS